MATELSPSERDVVRLRLGLDDGVPQTAKEVAEMFGGHLSQAGKSAKTCPFSCRDDWFSRNLTALDFRLQLFVEWSKELLPSSVLLLVFIPSSFWHTSILQALMLAAFDDRGHALSIIINQCTYCY